MSARFPLRGSITKKVLVFASMLASLRLPDDPGRRQAILKFAIVVAISLCAGPDIVAAGKWMVLLAAYGFLEAHCSMWNTLISLWNHLPMLWPSLATNAAGLALNLIFVRRSGDNTNTGALRQRFRTNRATSISKQLKLIVFGSDDQSISTHRDHRACHGVLVGRTSRGGILLTFGWEHDES